MKWLFLLLPILCIGQKVEYYKYGYGGMVKYLKKPNSTTIFCDSLARPLVRNEAIDSIVSRYNHKLLTPGNLVITLKTAMVIGKIEKRETSSLEVYNFIYEKVIYKNGLIEVYSNPGNKK